MTTRLPDGFTVRIDRRCMRSGDPHHLVGGSPLRLLTLSDAAVALTNDTGTVQVTGAHSSALARRLLDAGVAHPSIDARHGAAGGPSEGASLSTSDRVTVVVPVRDNHAGLARLLAALPGHRVIVVDDASTDPITVDHRSIEPAEVRVIRCAGNVGPAAARNIGARASTTEFVAFLDSDTVPSPGWDARLLAHFDDPTVAVAAPRIVGLHTPPRSRPIAVFADRYSSLDMGPRAAQIRVGNPVAYVPSAAMIVRRTAFDAIDGFDAELSVAEDVDLCWRITAEGWTARYEPSARVAHDHRHRIGALLNRRRFYGTGAAELAHRHGEAAAPVVMTPPVLLGAVGLLSGTRCGVLVAAGTSAWTFRQLRRALAAVPDRNAIAAQNTARAAWYGAELAIASALRHHWPLSVAIALVWPAFRRRLIWLSMGEAVATALAHRLADPAGRHPDLASWFVLHRLDDVAYGTGVWQGAFRRRSFAALRPVLRRRR